MDWQAYGLCPPASVIDATAAYQRDSDALGPFIDEALDFDANAQIRAVDLYDCYRSWRRT